MIQRIQTVYLFLSFLLLAFGGVKAAMALCTMALCSTKNEDMAQQFVAPYFVWGVLFACLLSLGAILSFVDIFLYSKRMKQVKVITIVQLLVIAAYICFAIPVFQNSEITFQMVTFPLLPAVSLLVCILARKAILRDERLVRAADRIR